jgi:hypothetical protein
MRNDRIFDVLSAALDVPSPLVRYSAAYALGEQRGDRESDEERLAATWT